MVGWNVGPLLGIAVIVVSTFGSFVVPEIPDLSDSTGTIVGTSSSPATLPSSAALLLLLLLLLLPFLFFRFFVPKLTPNNIATSMSKITSNLLLNLLKNGPDCTDDFSPEEVADIGDNIGCLGLS